MGRVALIPDPSLPREQVGRIGEALHAAGADPSMITTGDAEAAATAALAGGARFLVAAGDDRTVHQVVNAMMARPDGPFDLGVVPVRSSDLARTFGLPMDPVEACRHVAGTHVYELDVGRVTCCGTGGEEASRHFVVLAEAGFGARMAGRVEALPAILGRGRRFVGFWWSLAASRPRALSVTAGRKRSDIRAWGVVVGNCQFFGDGLRMSPRSYPGDGVLDVLIMHGPRSDAFVRMGKMFRGEHVPSPNITEMRGAEIGISADRSLPVHADGEVIGSTPATFTVLPGAVRLRV